MATITDFSAQGRRKQRIMVCLDGKPWAELDAETVARAGLRRDMTLDEAGRERLLAADQAVLARRAAAGLCAAGPRGRAELERRLAERGFAPAAIATALDELERSGTLDEARAIDATIRRRRRAGYGPRRIAAELRARGAAPGQVREQLDRALAGQDLEAECLAWARRAAARYQPLSDPANRRKLAQALLRRGYDSDMARAAATRVCRESGAPDDELE
jgi:regulatory protein